MGSVPLEMSSVPARELAGERCRAYKWCYVLCYEFFLLKTHKSRSTICRAYKIGATGATKSFTG